ncbi:MAG TPA: hypothetical protein PKZ68_00800 [Pseudomonadales bacterium]|jgi:uncharacterized membrane protein YGL010W|nr:hypothetical protein [Pseudomonadales bacterium]HNI36810.1 hypothetical protein [Pseudomonadales bacterium]HNL92259.1 hypothetical protein [Pseudomonadales bacterium]HNN86698.1 hypothetical protein [Pseudomonadales bacterium]
MKAIIPALFFAALGMPSGVVVSALLALLVFWVAHEQEKDSQITC